MPETEASRCLVSKIMSRLRLVATHRPYLASTMVSWIVSHNGAPVSPATSRFGKVTADYVDCTEKNALVDITPARRLLFSTGLPSPGEKRCAHNGKQRDLVKRAAFYLL